MLDGLFVTEGGIPLSNKIPAPEYRDSEQPGEVKILIERSKVPKTVPAAAQKTQVKSEAM